MPHHRPKHATNLQPGARRKSCCELEEAGCSTFSMEDGTLLILFSSCSLCSRVQVRPSQYSSCPSLLQSIHMFLGCTSATGFLYVLLCRQNYLVSLLHLDVLRESPLGSVLVKYTGLLRFMACMLRCTCKRTTHV